MISSYILLALVIFSFTLNPYLKKKASNNVSSNEFILIYQIIAIIFTILYVYYLLNYKHCSIACFKKLTKMELLWTIMAVLTGILGSVVLLYLIKLEEVSYIVPNIQGIVILFGAIIGFFVFQEKFDFFRISGITLIFTGILLLNYGKNKKE